MKPNVFLIDNRSHEDQLTAYWHWVLTVVPGLGLAKRNGWKLALMSASRIDIDTEVCQSPSFMANPPLHPTSGAYSAVRP